MGNKLLLPARDGVGARSSSWSHGVAQRVGLIPYPVKRGHGLYEHNPAAG